MNLRFFGILLFLISGVARSQSYTVTTFDAPSGVVLARILAMNSRGQILGWYSQPPSNSSRFLLRSADGGTYTAIDVPGATETSAQGLNNLGQVVGYFSNSSGTHSFIRNADGTYSIFDIPPEGGIATHMPLPRVINDKGEIAGTGFSLGSIQTGFLLSSDHKTYTIVQAGTWTDVSGIDNNGDVVGTCRFGSSYGLKHGFLRKPDGTYRLIDEPGGTIETGATAVNNRAQVLLTDGVVLNSDGGSSGVDANFGLATALDDAGRLAGCASSNGICRGFVATPLPRSQPVIRPVRGVIAASAFGGSETTAPASWIEIYGSDLATVTRTWRTSDFAGDAAPTSLDGVTVLINGHPAVIAYVSPGQVNALTPAELTPGPVEVTVLSAGQSSAGYRINAAAVSPAVPAISEDVEYKYVAALFPDYLTYALPVFVAPTIPPLPPLPSRPAKAGDTLIVYGIGFGSVNPSRAFGQIARQPDQLQAHFELLFDGLPGKVLYAGSAPGLVGVYQFNVVVPNGLLGSEVTLEIRLDGKPSEQRNLYLAFQP